MDGTEKPEYGKVVDIVTRDSLRELATPGLLAVLTPIAVGFGLGIGALGSYLAGTIATGTLMAVFLSNSGGAWDNAKKFVEDGNFGGKGSEAHAATVIGDTVGDPFKDTAGPAINPLIKVMNLVALLIAPAVVSQFLGDHTAHARRHHRLARGGDRRRLGGHLQAPSDRGRRRPGRVRSRLTPTVGAGGTPSLDADAVSRLRDHLRAAGYTVDGVLEILGPAGLRRPRPGRDGPGAAGDRGRVPAARRSPGCSSCRPTVTAAQARAALGDLEPLVDGRAARAGRRTPEPTPPEPTPSAPVWTSARTPPTTPTSWSSPTWAPAVGGVRGPVQPDHVLGVGGASTTLAQLTVRLPVGQRPRPRHRLRGAGPAPVRAQRPPSSATDTNPRALAAGRASPRRSASVELDLRAGQPVRAGRRASGSTWSSPTRRSSSRRSPAVHLPGRRPGRRRPVPRSWSTTAAGPPRARRLVPAAGQLAARARAGLARAGGRAGWSRPGCDALGACSARSLDPAEYVELWLRDSGDERGPQYTASVRRQWLDWFDRNQVEGGRYGLGDHARHRVRLPARAHRGPPPAGRPAGGRGDPGLVRAARACSGRSTTTRCWRSRRSWRPTSTSSRSRSRGPAAASSGEPARVRQGSGLCRSGGIDPVGVAVLARGRRRAPAEPDPRGRGAGARARAGRPGTGRRRSRA